MIKVQKSPRNFSYQAVSSDKNNDEGQLYVFWCKSSGFQYTKSQYQRLFIITIFHV